LLPILFLLFALILLLMLEEGPITALGFIDDTNILTFIKTTEENCQRLEAAHTKCLRWAAQHGAAFAPPDSSTSNISNTTLSYCIVLLIQRLRAVLYCNMRCLYCIACLVLTVLPRPACSAYCRLID